MKSKESLVKKQNPFSSFEDLSKTASYLSNDISVFLAEEIDELNISSYTFRSGMERSLMRVLNSLVKQPQPVVIFPDSVPGFTMMTFRKSQLPEDVETAKVERNPVKEVRESQVLDNVINRFFAKNQQKVLLIENADVIFALFPVADTRKNLRDMELYITF